MKIDSIVEMLIDDEGDKQFPYDDADGERIIGEKKKNIIGKITIAIGRNIEDRGLSEEERLYLLFNDIDDCIDTLNKNLPWWTKLDESRRMVLINMCFQLSITGLLGFREFLYQLERGAYLKAANEMLDSVWAKEQTPNRANRLAKIMIGGEINE